MEKCKARWDSVVPADKPDFTNVEIYYDEYREELGKINIQYNDLYKKIRTAVDNYIKILDEKSNNSFDEIKVEDSGCDNLYKEMNSVLKNMIRSLLSTMRKQNRLIK